MGEGTFAGTRGNDKVAPIADLPALILEWGGSTLPGYACGSSARQEADVRIWEQPI